MNDCSVPVLLIVAVLVLTFGQDHPTGKWSDRYNPAVSSEIRSAKENSVFDSRKVTKASKNAAISIHPVEAEVANPQFQYPSVNIATNKFLTFNMMAKIISSPLTWLPALAYLTTFGVELTIDNEMANVLFARYSESLPGFTRKSAGYYASIL